MSAPLISNCQLKYCYEFPTLNKDLYLFLYNSLSTIPIFDRILSVNRPVFKSPLNLM